MDTIELLDKLPEEIAIINEGSWDDDNKIYYTFNLIKDEGEYELYYYSHLWDKELISFTGNLHDVAEKMYNWCKTSNYC